MLLFPHVGGGWFQIALLTVAFSLGGVVFALGVTMNAEISPTRQRGAVLSITVGLVTTTGLLAPYLTGRLIQAASTPESGFTLAFTISGLLSVAGGLLAVFFVNPDRTARQLGLRADRIEAIG